MSEFRDEIQSALARWGFYGDPVSTVDAIAQEIHQLRRQATRLKQLEDGMSAVRQRLDDAARYHFVGDKAAMRSALNKALTTSSDLAPQSMAIAPDAAHAVGDDEGQQAPGQ